MENNRALIRIVQTPDGEAPEWVREAWVGLTLPLAVEENVQAKVFGVLSGPRSWIGGYIALLFGRADTMDGYIVFAQEAFAILAESNVHAVEWWWNNTNMMRKSDLTLMFDSASCEEI